jgi:GNAT superfamily N-acetyltransferase
LESLVIRNYESKDLQECHALWKQLTEWHRELYDDPAIGGEHPEHYFDRHLEAVGAGQLWVAAQSSHVIGLTGLIVRGDEAEVEPLIVAKSHRGKGIGSRLIEKVIVEARARRIRLLTVKPVARNVKTIQFLHKHGFTNLGVIELFMDFSNRTWKSGPEVFACEFRV